MKIVAFIISILFALLIVYPFYRLYKNPNDTLIKYLFDWRYRALREYRQWYLQGQSHTPPDSFEFWYNSVVNDLDTGEHAKRPLYEREALCEMLRREEYVSYYFQKWETFEGKLYEAMWNDYRSGLYLSRDYDNIAALKKKLPVEISSHPRACSDYIKLVEANLLDATTGLLIEGVQKQMIGRALDIIVRENLPAKSPAKIFAPFFGISEDNFREWTRNNKNNEEITKNINAEIKQILGYKQ